MFGSGKRPPAAEPRRAAGKPTNATALKPMNPLEVSERIGIQTEFTNFGCRCVGFFLPIFLVPLLFALAYHAAPLFVIIFTCFLMLAALLPLGMPHGSPLAAGLLVTIVGAAVGGLHIYYAYALPLRAMEEGRTYSNAYVGQPAVVFADAAVINFAGNATVDTSKGLGMTNLEIGPHKYCVAPVVDEDSTGRVNFWAIGVDCCSKLGDFECGDAGEPGVRGGYALSDRARHDIMFSTVAKFFAPPVARQDIFMEALKHSEAVFGLVASSKPLLLFWSSKSRLELAADARSKLASALIVTAAVSFVAAAVLAYIALRQQKCRESEIKAAADAGHFDQDTPAEVTEFCIRQQSASLLQPQGIDDATHRRNVFLLSFVAPVVAAVTSTVLWSWIGCFKGSDAVASVFVGIAAAFVAALLLTPGRRSQGLLMMLAVVSGSYFGRWNYLHNTFHFCTVMNHRSYTDVPPGASAVEYGDAGRVHFEAASGVDGTKTIGYLHHGQTYCAAPVVSSLPPASDSSGQSISNVDFWAVGVGCCESRGGFKCGGGSSKDGSTGVPEGLVLRSAGADDFQYRMYLNAVRASAEHYGLIAPKAPILLHWGGDLDSFRQDWLGKAVGLCFFMVGMSMFAFGIASGMTLCCARWAREQEVLRMDQKMQRGFEGRSRAEDTEAKMVENLTWFYMDAQSEKRGPYKTKEMLNWFKMGYFKDDIQIRVGNQGNFNPLRVVFPSPGKPFESQPRPEFLTSSAA